MLTPAHFVFCVIIMVIPPVFCFPSFLTISYRFSWCFHIFSLVFLRFPRVFLLFPLSVSPVFYFRFCVFEFSKTFHHPIKSFHHPFIKILSLYHLVCYITWLRCDYGRLGKRWGLYVKSYCFFETIAYRFKNYKWSALPRFSAVSREFVALNI